MGTVQSIVIDVADGAYNTALLVKRLCSGRIASNPVLSELEERATRKEGQGNRDRRKSKRRRRADRVKHEEKKTLQQEKNKANENAHEKEREDLVNFIYTEMRENIAQRISPIVMPTQQEIALAKARFEYRDDILHIAIAGTAGSGKSSLINALRGLINNDPGAAPTGVTETTLRTTRYPDPNPVHPWVWYDVPGAGTRNVPDSRYFVDQGLYIFDAIIVLFDNRFTETDIAILCSCERFCIPAYIVRSKSLYNIANVMNDEYGNNDSLTVEERAKQWDDARGKYECQSRDDVTQNLEQIGLPAQKVYFVDRETMTRVSTNSLSDRKKLLDEAELVRDLLTMALSRRSPVSASSSSPPAYRP